ncbi:hypothetical protein [Nitrosomonas marina]|uniref:Uncharacterized protein n=1 Tax=Nitrosomonas marina TaxID=917 RepID=A0A1H8GKQ6_9PROT|nr:hypothetical protein [Nitrosomonas marina]SEN44390.1 hypothetical protein SAMN05216325_11871 [Nitrosomonas marina]
MTNNADLTEEEIKTLTHTLTGSQSEDQVYRNYYAADENHHNIETLKALVKKGLMRKGKHYIDRSNPSYQFDYYHCTQKGAEAVGLHLPRR